MCGIAGIIDTTGATPDEGLLKRMHEILAHRGPDDNGTFVGPGVGLSHRRLSIIDLSPEGHQPMPNKDSTVRIVYNGEIYNYRELAVELEQLGHRFRSHSDTEVILHAYEEWGGACIQRFNGMFAFALWDARRRELFAARDRLGIKPFYYWFNGTRFIFASEIKAILCDPAVALEPDPETIRQYLLFGNTSGETTWFRGVRPLPPGHTLRLAGARLAVREYWDVRLAINPVRPADSFAEELRALLQDAVRLHLRSDVPVGAHLSGGVDSSTVVALASRELPRLHTFSSAYNAGTDYDERRYIDIVSRQFGTQHHVVVPGADDLPHLLSKLIWHLDEPVIGAAILPMFRVSEMVRAHGVKVVNGGQGADEAFGGYPPYFVRASRNLIDGLRGRGPRGPWSECLRIPSYLVKGGALRRLPTRWRAGRPPEWIRDVGDARQAALSHMDAMQKRQPTLQAFELGSYLDLKHYLPGLLQQEDRMSMANSIESRVPLLDHRIIELSAQIPSWLKVQGGISKAILRQAVRGITPDAILDRRDKKGYPVPTSRWFRGELAGYLQSILTSGPLRSQEVIDQARLREVVAEHISGRCDHGGLLWRALNTELWFRGLGRIMTLPHA